MTTYIEPDTTAEPAEYIIDRVRVRRTTIICTLCNKDKNPVATIGDDGISRPVTLTLWARDIATMLNWSDLAQAGYDRDDEEIACLLTQNARAIESELTDLPITVGFVTQQRELMAPRKTTEGVLITHYDATEARVPPFGLPSIHTFKPYRAPVQSEAERYLRQARAELALEEAQLEVELLRLEKAEKLNELRRKIAARKNERTGTWQTDQDIIDISGKA